MNNDNIFQYTGNKTKLKSDRLGNIRLARDEHDPLLKHLMI